MSTRTEVIWKPYTNINPATIRPAQTGKMARKSGHDQSVDESTNAPSSKTRSSLRSTRSKVDLTGSNNDSAVPSKPASRKRKVIDLTQDNDLDEPAPKSSAKKQKKDEPEKRLKPFRQKAPQTFLQKLERATTQRMIVIGRTRSGLGQDLHENIDIVGTTGNIYTVTIARLPSCTCPDSQKGNRQLASHNSFTYCLQGNECKHKVYALANVLKAAPDMQYQRAFLTNELESIFADAPPIPNATSDSKEDNDGKRKPVEGECPICYMDFDPDNNELVWCKAACGNNMHKTCFEQWAASQRGQEVRCVYCRTPWQMEIGDLASIKKAGQQSGDGYINVADQFGISRARDYSSYHQHWVRRNFGYR